MSIISSMLGRGTLYTDSDVGAHRDGDVSHDFITEYTKILLLSHARIKFLF